MDFLAENVGETGVRSTLRLQSNRAASIALKMSDWYFLANNEQAGPITESELKDYFSSGKLSPDTFVWKEGMEGWANANELPVFSVSPESVSANPHLPVETASATETLTSPASPVVLDQKDFLRGRQTFVLVNDQVLRFQIGKGKKRMEGEVRLDNINPSPQRIRKWHIGSLILAVPMILLSLILLVAGIAALFSNTSSSDLFAVFIVDGFSIVFTALLVGNVYVKRQNSIVFTTDSGAPLTLWFENPDKKNFDEFLSHFQPALARIDRTTQVQTLGEKELEQPQVCFHCQSPQIVSGYPTPLCDPCRNLLVNKPVPLWLKIAAGALAFLMLISAIRIPRELGASIAYERGQIAEQNNNYTAAAKEYQKALVSYPKSVDILCALARSAHRAGDQDTATQCVNQIIAQAGPNGDISKETVGVINEVRGTSP